MRAFKLTIDIALMRVSIDCKRMFNITRGPITITCETPEELQHALDAIRRGVTGQTSVLDVIVQATGLVPRPDHNPWTPRTFSAFVTAIGPSQTTVLVWLVRHMRGTDAQLREAVGVKTNQQLAGILSGVSKQAAACHLSAREVFTIENESKSGETRKTYVISRHFLEMATANNWPLDETPGTEPREIP